MKQSLFASSKSRASKGTPLAQLVAGLVADSNKKPQYISPAIAGKVVAMEGLGDEQVKNTVSDAVTAFTSLVKNTCRSIEGYNPDALTIAQEEAASAAGVLAHAIRPHMTRDFSLSALQRFASDNTVVVGHDSSVSAERISMEAFDEKQNKNAMAYSVAYNLSAAKQDEFGEGFYPTVVVTPENVGFMMSIRLLYVYDEVRRDISGSASKFGRKNVIKAVIDASILRNDQTKIVPIYRKTNPAAATDSDKFFSADVGTTTIIHDGASVQTGALAIGKKFDLLGISQPAAMLAGGQNDQTDAVDSSVRLGAIYVKLKGATTADDEVIRFATDKLPFSDFNAAPQNNTRTLQLNFENSTLLVTKDVKQVDGTPSDLLAALTTNTARLGVKLYGSVVQDTGLTSVSADLPEVSQVKNTAGVQLDPTTGAGKTVADVFIGATVVGYDLIAYRTNSNRRQRGQLIDTQYMNYLYTVPLLPPITALRPVGETETNDQALLAALVTTTHIRTSNAAVTALLEARDFLRAYVNSADAVTDAPEVLGASRHLVSPAYLEDELDVEINLDSLIASKRTLDLQSLIQNKIRDMAYRLYVKAGYKAAADAMYDGNAPKPMLIVGSDQILSRYLTIEGDTRLAGEAMDYKLVTSQDSRIEGKIFFSFGMEESYNSGVPNPLHFGNMAWKPELTLMMPMVRNGSNAMELTVQPSFRHVTNLPILGVLSVKNIEKVIAAKVDVYTKEQ